MNSRAPAFVAMLSLVPGCLVDNKRYNPLETDSAAAATSTTTSGDTGDDGPTSGRDDTEGSGVADGTVTGGTMSDGSATGVPATGGPVGDTGTPPGADWWDEAWPLRRKLLFSLPPEASAQDFTVPVPVSRLFAEGRATDDGSDLRFVSNTGEVLPHELESWLSPGSGVAWLTLPALDPLEPPEVTLYYGNPNLEQPLEHAPFYNEYVGVWHLADALDSSGGGAPAFAPGEALGPAFIGWGATLTIGQQPVLVPNFEAESTFEEQGFTFSAWVRIDQVDDVTAPLYCRLDPDDGIGLQIEVDLVSGTVVITRRDPDGLQSWLFPAGVEGGQWTHVFVRYGGGALPSVMVDATPIDLDVEALDPGTVAPAPEPGLTLGGLCYGDHQTFGGALDEVRVSSIRRDDAWGLLMHEATSGSIATLGEREEFPG